LKKEVISHKTRHLYDTDIFNIKMFSLIISTNSIHKGWWQRMQASHRARKEKVAQYLREAKERIRQRRADRRRRIHEALQKAHDRAKEIAQAAKDRADELAQHIKDKAEELAQAAQDKAEEIAQKIKDKAEDLTQAAKSGFAEQIVRATVMGTVVIYTSRHCGTQNDCIQEAWPEANSNRLDYTHNDGLLQYSRLMLAFVLSGYKFEKDGDKDVNKFLPVTPGANNGNEDFCKAKKGEERINFEEIRIARGTDTGIFNKDNVLSCLGSDTAASLYEYQSKDEYLIVWNFRGSEVVIPAAWQKWGKSTWGEKIMGVTAVKDFMDSFKDWLGSDLEMKPQEDDLCRNPNVKMHGGFREAYLMVKEKMVKEVKASLKRYKGNHPVKIFIVGHSLGAAMSNIAIYDIFCNKLFGDDIDYKQQVFNIGYGTPIVWYRDESHKAYQDVVPSNNRVRINTISHFSNEVSVTFTDGISGLNPFEKNTRSGYSGDIVGTSFPRSNYKHADDDFQASMQPSWVSADGGSCGGGLNGALKGGLCHLLDRYLVGLTDSRYYLYVYFLFIN
jgi:flagellar biosynthesis GTPase FlhF